MSKSIEAQHGLLIERAKGIYSFSHLTFHEYFCAREIVFNSNSIEASLNELMNHVSDRRWREVFLLTAEILTDASLLLFPMKQYIVVTGECEIETGDTVRTLQPGDIFAIVANHPHKFRTHSDSLTIVVFHPDSDIGFTHHSNPMLEKTIVDSIKASNVPQIQTKLD